MLSSKRRRARLVGAPISAMVGVICLSGAIAALGAGAGQKPKGSTTISYPNFKKTKGLKLNGDAKRQGKVLRVVPADNNQLGSFFTRKEVLTPSKSFKLQFKISLHDGTDPAPGDGLVFVIQHGPATKKGNGGGGIGYSGIGKSIGVEFDDFINPEANDPLGQHVAVLKNGNTGNHLGAETPDAGVYGGPRSVWLDYSAKKHRLKVFFTDKAKKPRKALISQKIDLAQTLEGKSRIGFTASSGGSTQDADVLKLKLEQ